MRLALLAAASFGVLALAGPAVAADVESLRMSGPVDKRFNLVVVGDGYRTVDQTQLSKDAKHVIDQFFSISPLKEYAGFFNVKLVHVISQDNGADHGSYGDLRDTALGANFYCNGSSLDRLLCVNNGLAQAAAAADVDEVNFVIAIVNDTKYGGSGGPVPVASIDPLAVEIVAHEVGHSMADLADEYSSNDATIPCGDPDCEANVTFESARDQIKWNNWIEAQTPVPTPATNQYAASIGLFEGARYQSKGIYRSQLNCKMRDLAAEYCAVCREQFIRSIWVAPNIQMIESSSPAGDKVTSSGCDPVKLEVTSPPITPSTYRYVWSVDGMAQASTANALELAPGALGIGDHMVKVDVDDATEMVRTDPKGLLHDSRTWTVSVSKGDCPVPVGGAGGGGLGGSAGVSNMAGNAGSGGTGTGGNGTGGTGTSTGGAGGSVPGSAGTSGAGAPLPMPPPPQDSGCGCYVAGEKTDGSAFAALAVATLLGASRRRRRHSAR